MIPTTPSETPPWRRLLAASVQACIDQGCHYQMAMETFDGILTERLLVKHGNNQLRLAAVTGLHRNTIGRKIKEFGIRPGSIQRRERRPEKRSGLRVLE